MQSASQITNESPNVAYLHKGLLAPNKRISSRVPFELGVREVILNPLELRVLFSEIASYGKRVEAIQKSYIAGASETVRNLSELLIDLVQRKTFAAQIFYEYKSTIRTDTFISDAHGVTCVREEHPFSEEI